ncbi:flagellar export chaperone FliS [Oceanobacter mangrovi]|uniref:flagellar export chaperone FliS n=1 Tax=Oceanobacter mangrovi TaxID=2862510 RepID=UPI001C8E7DBE|nr:flagellar export chaperone FliS [Oceanobacter mangrovi]
MYHSGAKQYQRVNVTSEVLDADPHRLIQLLMEAALTRMAQSKSAIERKDMETKANLLGRVIEIIGTLQSSLDHSSGGEISLNLERLYDYMNRRLLQASIANDVEMIEEVMGLLLEVKRGWDGIREDYLSQAQGKNENTEPRQVATHISV